jgi:hypothetical protein
MFVRRLPLGILLLAFSTGAAADERFFELGARAASLGGAFTAVADDATAYYWNPAGIAFGPVVQAGLFRGENDLDRPGKGLFSDRATGFSIGYTFMGVAGTWLESTSSRQENDVLSTRALDTFDLTLSILQSLPIDNLVVAGNIHYLRGTAFESDEILAGLSSAELDPVAISSRARSREGRSSQTWAVDLAALYEPNPWLRVGVMWRGLNEPEFETASGSAIVSPRHARAGLAFRLPTDVLVAFDADISSRGSENDRWREMSLGAEKGFFDRRVFARVGTRVEVGSDLGARPALSLGAGAKIRFLLVEVAYLAAASDRDRAWWFGMTFK